VASRKKAKRASKPRPAVRSGQDIPRPGEKTTTYQRQRDDEALRRLTIYLPVALARRLKVQAAERDETISQIITRLVTRHLG
jgi:hypothetical protein